MGKRIAAVLLACFLLSGVAPARAQQPITIVHELARYDFAEKMSFEVVVNGALSEANLLYQIEGEYAQRRNQGKISGCLAQVKILLRPGEIPPASEITYAWELKDTSGNTLRTADKSFLYLDERFEWSDQTRGEVELFWYGNTSANAVFAQTALAFGKIDQKLGLTLQEPIKIVAYENWSDMRPAVGTRWDGTTITTLGVAFDQRVLAFFLHRGWEDTLTHEMTHLLTYQLLGEPYNYLPFWLSEGLATYAETDSRGSITDPLRLSYVSATPTKAELVGPAYAQAQSLLTFLVEERGGREKIPELLTVVGEGNTIDTALLAVYGFDRYGLEKEWREWIGQPIPENPEEEKIAESASLSPNDKTVVIAIIAVVALGILIPAYARWRRRKEKIE